MEYLAHKASFLDCDSILPPHSGIKQNALQLVSNQLGTIAIVIGSTVLPALNDLLDKLGPILTTVSDWAEANPELTRTLIYIAVGLVAAKVGTVALGFAFHSLATPLLVMRRGLALAGLGLTRLRMAGLRFLFANPVVLAVAAIVVAALAVRKY